MTSSESLNPSSIEDLARRTRQIAGVGNRVPVDLGRILRTFRIDGPYSIDSPLDGQLRMNVEPPVLLVNENHTETRQRFTIAHELGHFVFRSGFFPDSAVRPLVRRFRSEEHFCDSFAGALLLPADWLKTALPSAQVSRSEQLSALVRVADESRVSLSSALVRLRQLHRWRTSLLEWRVAQSRWHYEWDRGLHPSDYGRVETNHETLDVLWAIRSAPRSDNGTPNIRPLLPLTIDGVSEYFEVEYLVRGSMVCASLHLPAKRSRSNGFDSRRRVA